jgi:hypothetical protein
LKKIIYAATIVNLFLLLSFYNTYSGFSIYGYSELLQNIWVLTAPASFFLLLNYFLFTMFVKKKNYNELGGGMRFLLFANMFMFLIFTLLLFFTLPKQD